MFNIFPRIFGRGGSAVEGDLPLKTEEDIPEGEELTQRIEKFVSQVEAQPVLRNAAKISLKDGNGKVISLDEHRKNIALADESKIQKVVADIKESDLPDLVVSPEKNVITENDQKKETVAALEMEIKELDEKISDSEVGLSNQEVAERIIAKNVLSKPQEQIALEEKERALFSSIDNCYDFESLRAVLTDSDYPEKEEVLSLIDRAENIVNNSFSGGGNFQALSPAFVNLIPKDYDLPKKIRQIASNTFAKLNGEVRQPRVPGNRTKEAISRMFSEEKKLEELKEKISSAGDEMLSNRGKILVEQDAAIRANLVEAAEDKPAPETEEVKDVVEQAYEKFGFAAEDLNSIEGFSELSEGQKLFVLENLRQISFGKVKDGAEAEFEKQTNFIKEKERNFGKDSAWAAKNIPTFLKIFNTSGKVASLAMNNLAKNFKLAGYEKRLAAEQMNGGLAEHGETLRLLVEGMKDGPEVLEKDGDLEIQFASLETWNKEEEKAIAVNFNQAATEFMRLPKEWNYEGATKEQQAKYEEVKAKYEEARSEYLEMEAMWFGEKWSAQHLNSIDTKIQINQFINQNPEAEEELLKISTQSELSKGVINSLKSSKGRGLSMATGFATRSLAVATLGAAGSIVAAPLVAGAFGAWRGGKKAESDLKTQDKEARRGVGEIDEKAKNFVPAVHLIKRLSDLTNQYNEAMRTDQSAKAGQLLMSLKARIDYTQEKIDDGLVDFGAIADYSEISRQEQADKALDDEKRQGVLGHQLSLVQELSLARALIAERNFKAEDGELMTRLEKMLEACGEKIADSRQKYVKHEIIMGAVKCAGFALAGAVLRDVAGEWFGWNKKTGSVILKAGADLRKAVGGGLGHDDLVLSEDFSQSNVGLTVKPWQPTEAVESEPVVQEADVSGHQFIEKDGIKFDLDSPDGVEKLQSYYNDKIKEFVNSASGQEKLKILSRKFREYLDESLPLSQRENSLEEVLPLRQLLENEYGCTSFVDNNGNLVLGGGNSGVGNLTFPTASLEKPDFNYDNSVIEEFPRAKISIDSNEVGKPSLSKDVGSSPAVEGGSQSNPYYKIENGDLKVTPKFKEDFSLKNSEVISNLDSVLKNNNSEALVSMNKIPSVLPTEEMVTEIGSTEHLQAFLADADVHKDLETISQKAKIFFAKGTSVAERTRIVSDIAPLRESMEKELGGRINFEPDGRVVLHSPGQPSRELFAGTEDVKVDLPVEIVSEPEPVEFKEVDLSKALEKEEPVVVAANIQEQASGSESAEELGELKKVLDNIGDKEAVESVVVQAEVPKSEELIPNNEASTATEAVSPEKIATPSEQVMEVDNHSSSNLDQAQGERMEVVGDIQEQSVIPEVKEIKQMDNIIPDNKPEVAPVFMGMNTQEIVNNPSSMSLAEAKNFDQPLVNPELAKNLAEQGRYINLRNVPAVSAEVLKVWQGEDRTVNLLGLKQDLLDNDSLDILSKFKAKPILSDEVLRKIEALV